MIELRCSQDVEGGGLRLVHVVSPRGPIADDLHLRDDGQGALACRDVRRYQLSGVQVSCSICGADFVRFSLCFVN